MFELISVDDHLVEPPDVWTSRLPARFVEDGPRLIEIDGGECWELEGQRYLTLNNELVAGRPPEEWGADDRPIRRSDMPTPYKDPVARANELASNGIVASICFPTTSRFAGTLFLETKDRRLGSLCVEAYNDFVLDEWSAAVADFYIPMVITQVWDPVAAAAEVRRCAAKGARAVSLIENPEPLGLPSYHTDHWNPLWHALSETRLPVCMHIGTSGFLPLPSADAPYTTAIILAQTNAASCLINLLFSPVVRDFPAIRFVLSEGGIGWIPALLERADRMWENHRVWNNLGEERPSDLFRRSFFGSFVSDAVGVQLREQIGVERILWESDYPHGESSFPNSQAIVQRCVGDEVSARDAARIMSGNARELFNWPAVATTDRRSQ